MSPLTYYMGSVIFLAVNIVGAIFIPDIQIVFVSVGAFVMTFVCFIWPGVFYLIAKTQSLKKSAGTRTDTVERIMAYVLITTGILVMGFVIATTVIGQ